MANICKLLGVLIVCTMAMTVFATLYFGLAWTLEEMFLPPVDGRGTSLEQEVGPIAIVAGFCAGLGLAMSAVSKWLEHENGRPDVAIIAIGWLVTLPVIIIVSFETFEGARLAVMRHGAFGVLTFLFYLCVMGVLWRNKH
jgi:hypothetical protein